jgi:site-specific DNA-methyltransferase (adenine-specific)
MHKSETLNSLNIVNFEGALTDVKESKDNVEFIILPYYETLESIPDKDNIYSQINLFFDSLSKNSTIAILTSPIFAADFCSKLNGNVYLKLWIAVKMERPITNDEYLTQQHASLLIFTRYKESLKHTKTRVGYSYCPVCDKTTKDYGGKKHLYHEFGTLLSDVWRDIVADFNQYPKEVELRLTDLFGLSEYQNINIYDQRDYFKPIPNTHKFLSIDSVENIFTNDSILLNGDCLEQLKMIPDNSIDFCFADPPYNLKKKYENWDDGIDVREYFEWCDNWLTELARVLKPGRTLAVLNIPQWCIRHFKHLNQILDYQDWIVWEGLSMPVRMIMPAHYSILCFSKGKPRKLPAIYRTKSSSLEGKSNLSLKEDFCIRTNCVSKRKKLRLEDTQFVTNLWHDIHRLKHNSRRVDHPCQLPPTFMYRLISLFTNEGEFILDPFNGVGTTTLAAHQLNRKYVGIELSEYYYIISKNRHTEILNGLDPFRKVKDDSLKVKNSPVERLKKQKYKVSKKALQLEVKNISKKLGHIPTKEEVKELSQFPIEYFEDYFINWAEVTAAARTTGMKESKINDNYKVNEVQLKLFEEEKIEYNKLLSPL